MPGLTVPDSLLSGFLVMGGNSSTTFLGTTDFYGDFSFVWLGEPDSIGLFVAKMTDKDNFKGLFPCLEREISGLFGHTGSHIEINSA